MVRNTIPVGKDIDPGACLTCTVTVFFYVAFIVAYVKLHKSNQTHTHRTERWTEKLGRLWLCGRNGYGNEPTVTFPVVRCMDMNYRRGEIRLLAKRRFYNTDSFSGKPV